MRILYQSCLSGCPVCPSNYNVSTSALALFVFLNCNMYSWNIFVYIKLPRIRSLFVELYNNTLVKKYTSQILAPLKTTKICKVLKYSLVQHTGGK